MKWIWQCKNCRVAVLTEVGKTPAGVCKNAIIKTAVFGAGDGNLTSLATAGECGTDDWLKLGVQSA